jgi:hypothetical protein
MSKLEVWAVNFFILLIPYSTLLHLPPLSCHCVGGCWVGTQDSWDFDFGCQTLYPLVFV